MKRQNNFRKKKVSEKKYSSNRYGKTALTRSVPNYNAHHFKQRAIPSSSSFVVTGGSYSSTDGLFKGAVPGATVTTFVFTPRLDDLPQSSTFVSMFDSYRINKVVLTFMSNVGFGGPQTSSFTGGAGTVFDLNPQQIYTVLDRDDATALSAVTDALDYESCKIHHPMKDFSLSFVPAISDTIYRTGVTSAYTQKYKQWIDAANVDVPHYGVKGIIGNNATAWQPSWKVIATYYVSFKQVR